MVAAMKEQLGRFAIWLRNAGDGDQVSGSLVSLNNARRKAE
jgi:hypothetical protein